MVRYARQAVPWTLVAVSAAVLALLIALVEYDPWRLWPLQGIGVGLLAAATAWCLDEPAAAVVDPSPRGLAWRTAARLPAVVLLAAVWCIGCWWARDSLFGHPEAVAIQGLAGAAMALAWVTVRRCGGHATPGQRLALTVVPIAAAWALVRPAEDWIPVFPYGPNSIADWDTSTMAWVVVGAVAALVVASVLATEGRRPSPRRAPTPAR